MSRHYTRRPREPHHSRVAYLDDYPHTICQLVLLLPSIAVNADDAHRANFASRNSTTVDGRAGSDEVMNHVVDRTFWTCVLDFRC